MYFLADGDIQTELMLWVGIGTTVGVALVSGIIAVWLKVDAAVFTAQKAHLENETKLTEMKLESDIRIAEMKARLEAQTKHIIANQTSLAVIALATQPPPAATPPSQVNVTVNEGQTPAKSLGEVTP